MGKSNKEKAEELYPTDFNYLGAGVINVPIKEREAFVKGAEWKEQQMIDWVRKNAHRYIDTDNDSEGHLCEKFLEDAFIDDFRKAMKGE